MSTTEDVVYTKPLTKKPLPRVAAAPVKGAVKAKPKMVGKPRRGRLPVKMLADKATGTKLTQGPIRIFSSLKNSGYEEMIARVSQGLPVSVVDEAVDYLHVTKGDLMFILSLKASSLSTWANKGRKVLPRQESDRIARVARVTGAIEQMIGSKEDAIEWLNTPVPALGSQRPISLLGSDAGAKLVEDTLFRALAGVYA